MRANLHLLRHARPMPMTPSLIRLCVPHQVVGAYLLYLHMNGALQPVYAGRSDTDLRRRLLRHPIEHVDAFVALPCASAWEAYLTELHAYYLFRPIYNRITPARSNKPLPN